MAVANAKGTHRSLVVEEGQDGILALGAILELEHGARPFPAHALQAVAAAPGEVEVGGLECGPGFLSTLRAHSFVFRLVDTEHPQQKETWTALSPLLPAGAQYL